MRLPADMREEIEAALGAIDSIRPLTGGDVNEAAVAEIQGQRVFLKWNLEAPEGLFDAEAEGLRALNAVPDGPRVPRVHAFDTRWLAMDFLGTGAPGPDFDERLGRELAAVHRVRARGYGWWRDNYLATLRQDNAWDESWVVFWREQRLLPLTNTLPGGLREILVGVIDRAAEWLPPNPPSARLHGDLWVGNHKVGPQGEPVLFDPAVYSGDREVDLAMTHLFGGFSERFYAAYSEAWPLEPEHERRRGFYQLYPLLVHVRLFGASYHDQLLGTAAAYR